MRLPVAEYVRGNECIFQDEEGVSDLIKGDLNAMTAITAGVSHMVRGRRACGWSARNAAAPMSTGWMEKREEKGTAWAGGAEEPRKFKKENGMKLCITSTGKEIDAKIDTTFGRAPYFLIIDTNTNAVKVVENRTAATGQGAGIAAAQILAGQGVDALLTGIVGPHAFKALRAGEILVFEGASADDTVRQSLEKFKRDEYKQVAATSPQPAGGLGRGRGHGRGRGRCSQV